MHTDQGKSIFGCSRESYRKHIKSLFSSREHDSKIRDYRDDKTQKTHGRIFDSGFFAKKKLSGLLQIMLLTRETK